MAETRQYCTFHLGDQYFGLDVLKVTEILRDQPVTRVPLAPHAVRGLINMRGQIVMALDLRRRLQMPQRADGQESINVVVQTDDGPACLLVDRIGDVMTVAESAFEHPPHTLDAAARELIRGAYKLKDRLLLVLDINKIVTPDAREAAPQADASHMQPSPSAGHVEYLS